MVIAHPRVAAPAHRAAPAAHGQLGANAALRCAGCIDLAVLVVRGPGGIASAGSRPRKPRRSAPPVRCCVCALRDGSTCNVCATHSKRRCKTSGLIYLVIIGALIFAVFISVTGLADRSRRFDRQASDWGPAGTIAADRLFLLLVGSVLDGLALMLLTTPILLPISSASGLSPIWFGIFLVRAMEIGFVHPPIGMNLYVIQGIAPDVPLSRIFKGVLPFLAADLLHLVLLIAVPGIALALPAWLD